MSKTTLQGPKIVSIATKEGLQMDMPPGYDVALSKERFKFDVSGHEVEVYNFGKALTKTQLVRIKKAVADTSEHFPEALVRLKKILISDVQAESLEGDEKAYPLNGSSYEFMGCMVLQPRALGVVQHRIPGVLNLEGTVAHEMAHLLIDYLSHEERQGEWTTRLKWIECAEHPEEWEQTKSPNGKRRVFVSRATGEMAPEGVFPEHPEQCITDYAKVSIEEDFCDSVAAYVYNPSALKETSLTKYEFLRALEAESKNG